MKIIVAASNNNVIGNQGLIPWNLPSDLKAFKKITMGGSIIMGRKTFESIGRPLPGRQNIVLTRDQNYKANGVDVVNGVVEAIAVAKSEMFIIGGSEIYELFDSICDQIILTRVDCDVVGDSHFNVSDKWSFLGSTRQPRIKGDEFDHKISIYQRKS